MQRITVGVSADQTAFIDGRGAPDSRFQLAQAYVHALAHHGAAVVVLPAQDPALAAGCLAPLDALVVSGGDMDVPPEWYGQVPDAGLGRVVGARSAFERALLAAAWAQNMPTLGICGGMQLMNVFAGGTLVQHLRPAPRGLDHQQPHDRRRPHHTVRLAVGSPLADLFADTEICEHAPERGVLAVNSTHHQAVARVGDGLEAVAWAPDGTIEAIACPARPFWLGVQWHPEVLGPPVHWRLYAALLEAARRA